MQDTPVYLRPIPCAPSRANARPLAAGLFGYCEVEVLRWGEPAEVLPLAAAAALFEDAPVLLDRIEMPRQPIAGLSFDRPKVMGVVNVTPDSFSDGGRYGSAEAAIAEGMRMLAAGADILDVGGESTRPGAVPVSRQEELDRVLPVIEGLQVAGCRAPISIDTRNSAVAREALAAGAVLFNDVSALSHDIESVGVARAADGLCLMHAQGDPRTMQDNPTYENVLLDIYDYLHARVALAEAEGIPRSHILVDPGIGFGKTLAHNLALIRRLSLFHTLGCPILLGVSRKRFIGTLSGVAEAGQRVAGSIAAGLEGLAQGAQVLRVHDVAETRQAIGVWQALREDAAP